ncbi:MAG: polysaccharide biosynthesis protein [Clostridiales bacterium]|jgi:stage V sporulation protein B|nr:polysaccharide biosynthesis protein [Clostridiales bacterium]
MKTTTKNTFLKGALILTIANGIVKIIGAVFKIPLARLIGTDGMGLFNSAYTLYAFMFTIATSGFPIAVSKMVAEATARGNTREAKRIFYVSLMVLGILGAAGSCVLYFNAQNLAGILKNSRAYIGIMSISPAVFFVAISCAFRGYFQGKQNMVPTALSNIMEAAGKLLAGYALAMYMLRWGVEFGAAGAVYGVGFGTAMSALLLFVMYIYQRQRKIGTKSRSIAAITKELMWLAIPVTLGACIQSITTVIDTFTITGRLQAIATYTEEMANSLYGAYSGFVVPIFGLPLSIVTALSISVVPSLSAALAVGDRAGGHRITASVLRVTTFFALPCAAGVFALADPIERAIFTTPPPEAGSLLTILAISILFASLLAVTSAVLQAHNRMSLPVIFMTIGGIIKAILNYALIPVYDIYAAPFATNVCYIVIVSLNIIAILRITKVKIPVGDILVKPFVASVALMAAAFAVINFMEGAGFGVRIGTFAAILAGGLAYVIMLFVVRAIKEEDIKLLPKGEKIAVYMRRFKII